VEPYSQVNQAAMKAPLSCFVPLACDLLALSKSSNEISVKAERRKKRRENQRDIKRVALIGLVLGSLAIWEDLT